MDDLSSSTGIDEGDSGEGLSSGLIVWGVACFLVTLAFTTWLVRRYQRPNTPIPISLITWLAWLVSFVIVFLVPLDIRKNASSSLSPVWSTVFWIGFVCTWVLLPMIQEFYDNGGFTFGQKLKLACRQNLILVCVALIVVIAMCLYLAIAKGQKGDSILTTFKVLSNAIGLILLIILGGYGLVEFPRMLYYSSHRSRRRDFVYYTAANTQHEATDVRDEFCELLKLITNVERKISSQHDATLQQYFDEIKETVREKELELQARNFKGTKTKLDIVEQFEKKNRLDTNDLIKLNQAVKKNVRHLWLCDQLWTDTVEEAFQLEAELADVAGEGSINVGDLEAGSALSKLPGPLHVSEAHMSWYRKNFYPRFLFIMSLITGATSILILWSELAIVIHSYGDEVDVSPFTYLVKSLDDTEIIQQIFTVLLIGYFMLCSVYPLFKLRISSMYYLGHHHSDTNSLIYNATIMLRASIALAYNFTLLLHIPAEGLGDLLGSLQEVPFLGTSFNAIFPLFMIVWSLMVAFNIVGRIMSMCNIERFQFITASASAGSRDLSDSQIEARGQISEGRQLVKTEKMRRDSAMAAGERFHFSAGMSANAQPSPRGPPASSSSSSGMSSSLSSDAPGGLSGYRGRILDKKEIRSVRQSSSANSLNSSLLSEPTTSSSTTNGAYSSRNRVASPTPDAAPSRFGRNRNKGGEEEERFLGSR